MAHSHQKKLDLICKESESLRGVLNSLNQSSIVIKSKWNETDLFANSKKYFNNMSNHLAENIFSTDRFENLKSNVDGFHQNLLTNIEKLNEIDNDLENQIFHINSIEKAAYQFKRDIKSRLIDLANTKLNDDIQMAKNFATSVNYNLPLFSKADILKKKSKFNSENEMSKDLNEILKRYNGILNNLDTSFYRKPPAYPVNPKPNVGSKEKFATFKIDHNCLKVFAYHDYGSNSFNTKLTKSLNFNILMLVGDRYALEQGESDNLSKQCIFQINKISKKLELSSINFEWIDFVNNRKKLEYINSKKKIELLNNLSDLTNFLEFKIRNDKMTQLGKSAGVHKIPLAEFSSTNVIKYVSWQFKRNYIKLEIESKFPNAKKVIYDIYSGLPQCLTDPNNPEKCIIIDKVESKNKNCEINLVEGVYSIRWRFVHEENQELSLIITPHESSSLKAEVEIKKFLKEFFKPIVAYFLEEDAFSLTTTHKTYLKKAKTIGRVAYIFNKEDEQLINENEIPKDIENELLADEKDGDFGNYYIEPLIDYNNHYMPVNNNNQILILQSNLAQNSAVLEEKSLLGNQCTGIVAYALMYNRAAKQIANWTKTEDFDFVLLAGSSFYKKCFEKTNRSRLHLEAEETLNIEIEIKGKNYFLSYFDQENINNCYRQNNIYQSHFKRDLDEFISSECDSMILTLKDFSFGIIKDNDSLYFVDSHCKDETGVESESGKAVVLQFKQPNSVVNLANHLFNNLFPNRGIDFSFTYNNLYSLFFLKISVNSIPIEMDQASNQKESLAPVFSITSFEETESSQRNISNNQLTDNENNGNNNYLRNKLEQRPSAVNKQNRDTCSPRPSRATRFNPYKRTNSPSPSRATNINPNKRITNETSDGERKVIEF